MTDIFFGDKPGPVFKSAAPFWLRLPANFISYIFHPLFLPIYVTAFMLYIHPVVFAGFSTAMKTKAVLIPVFINLTFFPLVTVLLAWGLKFIRSPFLRSQKERIIPYALSMVFYFWIWYVMKNNSSIPEWQKVFLLGGFITIIGAWLANIYFKVSMHGLAMGAMWMFVLVLVMNESGGSGIYLGIATLATGLVASSRFLVSDHTAFEIYAGLLLGMLCQAIAFLV